MKKAYVVGDNLLTSLGFTTDENIHHLSQGKTGLRMYIDPAMTPVPFCASRVDTEKLNRVFEKIARQQAYTRFEKMVILSARDALAKTGIDASDPKTLFILSTTKGNIDLLDRKDSPFEEDRIHLWKTARILSDFFGNSGEPLVISNACISGVLAVITGSELIQSGRYDNVVITGGDMVTPFVIAGFQSFKAASAEPCRPFDRKRNGLSLGEGCGTMILSSRPEIGPRWHPVFVRAGVSTNDANHISGPSRRGDGLTLAIQKTLQRAGKTAADVDTISAHGTATLFNDEMESIAISRTGMNAVPVNSLKGYFGHTLGAAGVIESVVTVRSMVENRLFRTIGFENHGVSEPIRIVDRLMEKEIHHGLKLAAGFGGCNAAALFSKDEFNGHD
ncbi:MAG: beta-ketoacyl synthase N-terminal-like domain-containing protein [bacterium]